MENRETAETADRIEIDNKIAKIKAVVLNLTEENYGIDEATAEVNTILGK